MVVVNHYQCLHCGGCVGLCPVNALTLYELHLEVSEACTECGICVKFCPVGALEEAP
ncbi:MAG: 4Fe-4S binding protein [Candidatus Thermoplasmatota archaeon]|nr:4Fe-4S binding protein [Candidatus Thermoplasmatota archaeon]